MEILFDIGDYEEAVIAFLKVTELTPDNYRGFNNLGGIYFSLQRWNEAREMFERSLRIEPSYAAYSNLGTLYFYEERMVDAAAMFEKALEVENDDYVIWGFLAATYEQLPDLHDQVLPTYRHAISLAEDQLIVNPRDPLLLSWGEEGSGPGQFTLPHGVFASQDGRVLVADREPNQRIQIFDAEGAFLDQWPGRPFPCDLFVDQDGAAYVAENGGVPIFNREGRLVSYLAVGRGPHSIWVDRHGDIYVAEVGVEDRLHKLARL